MSLNQYRKLLKWIISSTFHNISTKNNESIILWKSVFDPHGFSHFQAFLLRIPLRFFTEASMKAIFKQRLFFSNFKCFSWGSWVVKQMLQEGPLGRKRHPKSLVCMMCLILSQYPGNLFLTEIMAPPCAFTWKILCR